MKSVRDMMLLYAVTDRHWTGKQTLMQQVEDALKGGVTCVQLREKELEYNEFLAEALKIKEMCGKYNVPFVINDNVEIAIKSNADAIHVGQNDMNLKDVKELTGGKMIVGVSVQTVKQALAAEKNGADYLGVGAVFGTDTKPDADDVSHETLREICTAVSIPVVAIGGISKHNMVQLSNTGVDGVALVSAIFSAENIEAECKTLKSLAKKMVLSERER